MPKRKNKDKDNDSDDYMLRKIRKLEKKLRKRNRNKSPSTSSDASNTILSLQEGIQVEDVDVMSIGENMGHETGTVEIPLIEVQNDLTQQNIENANPDLPSTAAEAAAEPPEPVLDESIMELLGETPSKNKNYSSPIQTELAVRWEYITSSGLPKNMKKELLEKYLLPENCLKIGAPKLNPEIKAALSDTLVKKDTAIRTKQNQQAVAITCISQALTKIFASQDKDPDVIKLLIDASKLLCDSQYIESMSRRSFVTSTIKKDIKDQLFTTEIDNYLFGEKLADTLKTAKAISKSGAEMKTAPQPKPNTVQTRYNQSRPLNGRPLLPLMRQSGAGRRPTPVMQQPRRYQAPLPPPPPPPPPQPMMGHHSSLPTPPQRSRGRMQTRR